MTLRRRYVLMGRGIFLGDFELGRFWTRSAADRAAANLIGATYVRVLP